MIETVRRLVSRMFPELVAGYHLPVFAVVEGIADSPVEGGLADPYRPRWAVDLQLLDENGRPDTDQPLLESVPVTVPGVGHERGQFALPQPGTVVEVAWAYGRADQPFVRSVLPFRQSLPACDRYEQVWQQRDGVAQKVDNEGDWTRTTNASITDASEVHLTQTLEKIDQLQNEVREILEHSVEHIGGIKQTEAGTIKMMAESTVHAGSGGSLNMTAAGDQNHIAGGSLNQITGKDLVQDIGQNVSRTVAGSVSDTVSLDYSQTVAGTASITVKADMTMMSQGNAQMGSAGTTTVSAAGPLVLQGANVWIGSPAVNLLAVIGAFMQSTSDALTVLSTHTHPSVGTINEGSSIASCAAAINSNKTTVDGLQK
ncbi:hypothetical protein RE428_08030 [Marinobacter nanhaiticus D15-8W]|uniref:Gp5/Type VI secretion system Vgr protein OB-fold domain-containing protein n=1 Tax=Marinobacter nanhaiticus D15-8W TaxID=626887 RepID=N6VWE1_9GAMM|nr:hypothetical protein [Marinobacter nanhaiticus]ENO14575.1 hypothetical protein J057_04471 [Marinobacter nanhaiticus D15-8W]BES69740.1 hypothetical protein RE428_07580 [Marinobacter nanhaiticus D15-8W]BES69785.1 hypothetical protein RE428_08030 [Marinobacter nanhaiticus D15-8W]